MNRPPSSRPRLLRAGAVLVAAGTVLAATACGGSADDGSGDGRVTITVNGRPPEAQAVERAMFDADVAEFEEAHPEIDLEAVEGFMDPNTFAARLAGGQLEDVFYVYFTDPANLIARGQAADITEQAADMAILDSVRPDALDVFRDGEGRLYGIPTANYSMGLLYNRALFEEAGLDPDAPPETWEEVREAADAIAGLGDDRVGFAELSANNQGGWHFTAWMYAMGGQVVDTGGETPVAAFNNEQGRAVLRYLHDMRWADGSMGEQQLLEFEDAQRMMGSGNLGMYLAAPDNVSQLVNQFEGDFDDYGLAPMPGGLGTLAGGEGYMFNPAATPEQIEAGLTYLEWRFLNPDRFQARIDRSLDNDAPVGLPMPPTPDIWTGEIREQQEALRLENANVPVENYQPFVDAAEQMPTRIEPPRAQEVYAVLDTVMQAVLTDEAADFDALLGEAETAVNELLARPS
ncbi:ABC transporter substrate-binding protein [Allonocardiopsis opalescens]|uniref:ABC-type glycerol-3-phosphate transport system substrate-binding protein n=1 Tax=Allonocardiopsis opalescens TaxID=1144618 RepID=A0A2T0QEF2_9ACTN|nr:extracellular solute-binding protein [Allonocardiopsis opalescens]PRY02231.1 ABC-type glycerol-3-phosphate transport system substrate-binding protein [Allonocardiopsis opalescens]